MKLNLGCGNDIREGYLNCDITMHEGVDKVVDIMKKLPFKSNSIDEIYCYAVFEHIPSGHLGILKEFYRILKPNCVAFIGVPFYNHPIAHGLDHKKLFNFESFDGLRPDSPYSSMLDGMHFKIEVTTSSPLINYLRRLRLFGKDIGYILVNKIYGRCFSAMFPFMMLNFKLIAKKSE